MNPFDFFLFGVILTAGLFGFLKGFIRQLLAIVGLVVGFFAAVYLHDNVAVMLPLSDGIAKMAAFLAIFLGCIVFAAVFSGLAARFLVVANLSWLDRLCGACLGAGKGYLAACIVGLVLVLFLPSENRIIRNSKMLPSALIASSMVRSLLPAELEASARQKLKLFLK